MRVGGVLSMCVYYMYSFDCQQSNLVNEVDCILMSAKPVTITGSYILFWFSRCLHARLLLPQGSAALYISEWPSTNNLYIRVLVQFLITSPPLSLLII